MTGSARFDLHFRIGVLHPGQTVAMIAIPKNPFRFSDLGMDAAGPMARFATDVNFRERGVISQRFRIEVLL